MTARERAIQAAAAVREHTPMRMLDVPGFIAHMAAEFEAHAAEARREWVYAVSMLLLAAGGEIRVSRRLLVEHDPNGYAVSVEETPDAYVYRVERASGRGGRWRAR